MPSHRLLLVGGARTCFGMKSKAAASSLRTFSISQRSYQTPEKASHSDIKSSHPLLPSVMYLMREFDIKNADDIKGSGPSGRILKGDVLAHAGKINKSKPGELSQQLQKREKLDLSKIVRMPKKQQVSTESSIAEEPQDSLQLVEMAIVFDGLLQLQRTLQEQLSVSISLESFIHKASEKALRDVPAVRGKKSVAEDVFAYLVGDQPTLSAIKPLLPVNIQPQDLETDIDTSIAPSSLPLPLPNLGSLTLSHAPTPFQIHFDSAQSSQSSSLSTTATSTDDLFDYICGSKTTKSIHSATESQSAGQRVLNASIQVDSELVDQEAVRSYLDRIRYYLERPGELIL